MDIQKGILLLVEHYEDLVLIKLLLETSCITPRQLIDAIINFDPSRIIDLVKLIQHELTPPDATTLMNNILKFGCRPKSKKVKELCEILLYAGADLKESEEYIINLPEEYFFSYVNNNIVSKINTNDELTYYLENRSSAIRNWIYESSPNKDNVNFLWIYFCDASKYANGNKKYIDKTIYVRPGLPSSHIKLAWIFEIIYLLGHNYSWKDNDIFIDEILLNKLNWFRIYLNIDTLDIEYSSLIFCIFEYFKKEDNKRGYYQLHWIQDNNNISMSSYLKDILYPQIFMNKSKYFAIKTIFDGCMGGILKICILHGPFSKINPVLEHLANLCYKKLME